MTNRYIKKVPYYFVKEGSIIDHELYGKGEVIASYPKDGFVALRFADGHVEHNYDIKDKVMPQVFDVEAFKCPILDTEMLAERCACVQGGLKPCSFYHADLSKKESSCLYASTISQEAEDKAKKQENIKKAEKESIEELKALYDKIGEALKEASFEDVLGNIRVANTDLAVKHKVTGAHGEIEKQVSDNAVVVNWKNQECPCKTVVTNTEIEPDSDAKLMEKICQLREKFKKKYVKPITDFFKTKKASKEETLYKVDANKVLKALALKTDAERERFLRDLKAQLNSKGVEVDYNSIALDDSGNAVRFNLVKANNTDIVLEPLPVKEAQAKIEELGYTGDVLKVYASLAGQVHGYKDGYKQVTFNFLDEEELKSLF